MCLFSLVIVHLVFITDYVASAPMVFVPCLTTVPCICSLQSIHYTATVGPVGRKKDFCEYVCICLFEAVCLLHSVLTIIIIMQ